MSLLNNIELDIDEILPLDLLGLVLVGWKVDAGKAFVNLSSWIMDDNVAFLAY